MQEPSDCLQHGVSEVEMSELPVNLAPAISLDSTNYELLIETSDDELRSSSAQVEVKILDTELAQSSESL